MDIFNGNRRLEECAIYALDWGVFLRHDLEGPIAPFMFIFDGEHMQTRVLMTDGDPVEYAKKVLTQEEKPYQQFVIGMEGFLINEHDERIDSIIIHGFDKTQETGVILAQMFIPKEKDGGFKKISSPTFLGHPELLIDLVELDSPNYDIEEVAFSAVAAETNGLKYYMSFYTHANPSVIANTIRNFIRSKLSDEYSSDFSGYFEMNISSDVVSNSDFLNFLVLSAIHEERNSDFARTWEENTQRNLIFNCRHGELMILEEFDLNELEYDIPDEEINPEPEQAKNQSQSEGQQKKPWWKLW